MAKKTTIKRAKTNKRVAARAKVKAKSLVDKSKLSGLRVWNGCLAVLLAVQVVAIFILGKSVSLPVNLNFLNVDALASQVSGHQVLVPATRHLFDVNLMILTLCVLLVSMLFHTLIATAYHRQYESDIGRGVNKLRWIDYGLNAGVMLMTIGLLNGVTDIASLILIFVLIALLHLYGYLLESQLSGSPNARYPTFVGLLVAGGAVWLAITLYLKGAVIYGAGLAHFVYWLNGSIFVITLALAFNTYLGLKHYRRWASYLFGEKIYMLLSFIAKTAFAWQIYAALLK